MSQWTHFKQEQLIESYFLFLHENVEGLWAWQVLDDLIFDSPNEAWGLLLTLIDRAPSKDVVEIIGADHLEDFLKRNMIQFGDVVKEEAKSNPRLLSALRISRVGESYEGYEVFRKLKDDLKISKKKLDGDSF